MKWAFLTERDALSLRLGPVRPACPAHRLLRPPDELLRGAPQHPSEEQAQREGQRVRIPDHGDGVGGGGAVRGLSGRPGQGADADGGTHAHYGLRAQGQLRLGHLEGRGQEGRSQGAMERYLLQKQFPVSLEQKIEGLIFGLA